MNLLLMIKDHENILVADNDMSFKYTHIFNAIQFINMMRLNKLRTKSFVNRLFF